MFVLSCLHKYDVIEISDHENFTVLGRNNFVHTGCMTTFDWLNTGALRGPVARVSTPTPEGVGEVPRKRTRMVATAVHPCTEEQETGVPITLA